MENPFKELNERLENIEKLLKENMQPEQIMSTKEVAELFQVDRTTIYNWTNAGKLIAYGMGKRVYYKRSEVLAAMTVISGKAA